MSNTDNTQAGNGIHYFTCSEGRRWAHFAWGMITGDIPAGIIYPDSNPATEWIDGDNVEKARPAWRWTFPAFAPKIPENPSGWFALIPTDRIEIVTEHVGATVMDALQALLDSGGHPVEGWKFSDDDGEGEIGILIGVAVAGFQPFESTKAYYTYAFRPVTRVRIKPEGKPEPGYGYTLDGNPVPPPPEGWEIVPKGDDVPMECMYYGPRWVETKTGATVYAHGRAVLSDPGAGIRAYARRVAKEPAPATAEESSVVGASSVAPTLLHTNYASIGLTKREAFAMAAMQGICSDSRNCGTNERRAANAVAMADALLAELEKGKEEK